MDAAILDSLFTGRDSAIARDLKLNLKKLTTDGALSADEAALTLAAVAQSVGSAALGELAALAARAAGVTEPELAEAIEAAAIMGMLNRYYRFRHYLEAAQGKDYLTEHYRAAGLRMNGLSKPVLGKARFELLALAVSIVNGCEVCVTSHERELRQHGVEAEKIHDLARLAAVAAGVATLLAAPGSR